MKTFRNFLGAALCLTIASSVQAALDLSVSLGRAGSEGRELSFRLDAATLSVNTAKAAGWDYIGPVSDPVEVIDTAGRRQIVAPGGLFDLQDVVDGGSAYLYTELSFYHDPGTKSGDYYPGSNLYKTIRFTPSVSGTVTTLTIAETEDSVTKTTTYEYDSANGAWSLITAGGNRKETQTVSTGSGTRTVTTEIRDGSNALVSKVAETFTAYAWGEQLTQRVKDPGGLALTSTWTYESNGLSGAAAGGRLTSRQDENGYWEKYTYDGSNRLTKVVSQHLDAANTASDAQSRVREISYPNATDETEVIKLLGQEVGRRYTIYTVTSGVQTKRVEQCTVAGATAGAGTNLVTSITYLANGEKITHPDGTLTVVTRAESSGNFVTTTDTGKANSGGTAVEAGKREVLTEDVAGNLVSRVVTTIGGSSVTIAEETTDSTDAFGRPTKIDYLNGTSELFTYGCCGLEQKTDATGMVTSYSYDDFGNVDLESRGGLSIESAYDPLGRLKRRYRIGSDSSSILIAGSDYNLAGQVTATYNQFGTTTVAESIASNIVTRTETLPGGGTQVTETYADGKIKEVGGTAVFPQEYEYGVDSSDGEFTKTIKVGTGGSTTEWTKTFLDLAGRPWKEVYADSAATTTYWNNLGQLVRTVDPDGVTTLYGYNDEGEQIDTAIDANDNDTINTGSDRVTRSETTYLTLSGEAVSRTIVTEWNGGVAVETSRADTYLGASNKVVTSSFGSELITITTYSTGGDYSVTSTSNAGPVMTQTYEGGLLLSKTVTDGGSTNASSEAYTYDPHQRIASVTKDGLAATTFTYTAAGFVATATQGGVTTTYDYDAQGNKTSVSRAGKETTYEYSANGLLESVGGDLAYPVSYTYDPQGRVKTLTTAGAEGSAVTTWTYDSQRGWLSGKRYADNKGSDYTYTAAGRLATRTWARGVSADYSYNALGDRTGINYSDTTPDVSFGYDQRGRRTSATQGGTTTFTYTPNDAGQLTSESITGGPLDGLQVGATYDTYGRLETLTPEANTTVTQTYTYDGVSRLITASEGDFEAQYAYVANSSRIDQVKFFHDSTQTARTEKSYDTLGRLTSIATKKQSDSTVLSSHAYVYNDLDQRTQATLKDSSKWGYTYDDLGQLTNGTQKTSGNVIIPGREFKYQFDTIGNRTETTTNGRIASYTSNSLNQYTDREVPGVVDVSGKADATATVTVNNQPTARQGSYFYKALEVDNASAPQLPEINVVAVKNHFGPNDEDLVAEKTGHVYLEKTPEAYTYDDDGNTLSDGCFNYTWDAENRLVALESIAATPIAAKVKAEYYYDSTSRRIQKKVWHWNTSTSTYDLTETTKFLYQKWNLLAEINATDDIVKTHLWGSDLSGSFQGAGGVGGLLTTSTYGTGALQMFPAYDGNGNVMVMLSADTAEMKAEWEYDPFGQKIRASGPDLMKMSIGFSSKYDDRESGQLYYGYRYYDPEMGRWVNRDPSEEEGGTNLYGMIGNDGLNLVDAFGLVAFGQHLTLAEAKQLKCALNAVIAGGKFANSQTLGLAGNYYEYTYSLKFLDMYLNGSGQRYDMDPIIFGKNPGVVSGSQSARDHFKAGGGSPFQIPTLRPSDNLHYAFGRVTVDYWGRGGLIFGEFVDVYDFQNPTTNSIPPLSWPVIGSTIKALCCWSGSGLIDSVWMKDLETYGLAKPFEIHGWFLVNP